jgi:CRISPR-associated protein Cmr6
MTRRVTGISEEFALPEDTRLAVQDHLPDCQNLSLILDRYQPWCLYSWRDDRRNTGKDWGLCFEYHHRKHGPTYALDTEAKGYWLNSNSQNRAVHCQKRLNPNSRFDTDLHRAFLSRWKKMVSGTIFTLYAQSRVVIGLGSKGTLEMRMTLHRTYGFPYIPGSALKGLARTQAIHTLGEILGIPRVSGEEYIRWEEEEEDNQTPLRILDGLLEMPLKRTNSGEFDAKQYRDMKACFEEKLKSNVMVRQAQGEILDLSFDDFIAHGGVAWFREVFGTMGEAGRMVFYDAVPATVQNIIAVEIMTPHFVGYYQDNKFPRDDQNPEPHAYLAVEEGVQFKFCIDDRKSDPGQSEYYIPTRDLLRRGLFFLGVGGKTSSGLGHFGASKNPSEKRVTNQPIGNADYPSRSV